MILLFITLSSSVIVSKFCDFPPPPLFSTAFSFYMFKFFISATTILPICALIHAHVSAAYFNNIYIVIVK